MPNVFVLEAIAQTGNEIAYALERLLATEASLEKEPRAPWPGPVARPWTTDDIDVLILETSRFVVARAAKSPATAPRNARLMLGRQKDTNSSVSSRTKSSRTSSGDSMPFDQVKA